MPASVIEALEFIDWFRAAFAGWRFLVSASFRRQTLERWKNASWLRVFWDVMCGIAGFAFSWFLVYVVISLFAGWDWIQRLVG
jgi:hypothetical protein